MIKAGLMMLLGASVASGAPAEKHLVAGASHFREGRYAEALVEFRVAHSLGAPDAQEYAAAALVKLERPEEALELFGDNRPGGDALLEYYRASACYAARLYTCADGILGSIRERAGPRLATQIGEMHSRIAAELAKEPPAQAVDWYLQRCTERRDDSRRSLAAAYCREAAALANRRPDRYRLADAVTRLAQLENHHSRGAKP